MYLHVVQFPTYLASKNVFLKMLGYKKNQLQIQRNSG